jgi:hypothetical protein
VVGRELLLALARYGRGDLLSKPPPLARYVRYDPHAYTVTAIISKAGDDLLLELFQDES